MTAINNPNPSKMPRVAHRNISSASVGSQTTQTESSPPTPLKSKEVYIQSPHTSTDSTSPTRPRQTLTSSDLHTTTSTSTFTSTRPPVHRRTSTITWQDTHETNTTTASVPLPPILKKEVASSKAGRMKPAVEKLASWFKGSPVNLEEIEEAREDDRRWKRKVREWKEMREEVESMGGSVSGGGSISEKGYPAKSYGGRIGRVRRKLSCW